jgi:hypothetical protein
VKWILRDREGVGRHGTITVNDGRAYTAGPLAGVVGMALLLAACAGSGGADDGSAATATPQMPGGTGSSGSTTGNGGATENGSTTGGSGNSGAGGSAPPQNNAPVVDAGTDQTILERGIVILTGSASDADGDELKYSWAQTAGPAVELEGADAATASFAGPEIDQDTALEFILTVRDEAGAVSTDNVQVTILDDPAPLANAGPDTTVSERTIVFLDAGASADREGNVASYLWEQTSGPTVVLDEPRSARTQFTAPRAGSRIALEFRLTVTDDNAAFDDDLVTITVVPEQDAPDDPNEFLSYLNDASPKFAGSQESADAYYAAIDPDGRKTNLDDWLAANGFDQGVDARAVYRNAADLGFGRVMSMRTNNDGSVASYVENYPTLEAAVAAVESGERNDLLATVAMEFAAAPTGGARFTKFYTFGGDDQRLTSVDLDGRGAKFMPGLCNVCHGGEPKPLVNGVFPNAGDTEAQFLPWDLETYEFPDQSDFTRAAQEDAFKALNSGTLSTLPAASVDGHWSGAAARELIEGWYGGAGMPASTFDPQFVPAGWLAESVGGPQGNPEGSEALYLDVVAPNCRACHVQRGRYFAQYPQGELIDFSSYAKFMSYRDRHAELIYDQGVMPDALVTFERFWTRRNGVVGAERLAQALGLDAFERRPGRPLADPGPDRTAPLGTIALNGGASVFADEFAWSFAPGGRPANSSASIAGANSANATLTADVPGAYRVQLIVGNGSVASDPAAATIVALFGVEPARFSADVMPVLVQRCAGCHSVGGPQSVPGIPVRFDEPAALYERVRAYVDFVDIAASPLLQKPSGPRHGGAIVPGFDLSDSLGADQGDYALFLRWISEGALNN